jgi:hypothetical protein
VYGMPVHLLATKSSPVIRIQDLKLAAVRA